MKDVLIIISVALLMILGIVFICTIEKKDTSKDLSNPSDKSMYELKLENLRLDNEKKRLELQILKKKQP
jgi:hypothetical protein